MGQGSGNEVSQGYQEPRVTDYGTLAELTGDSMFFMRQMGIGAAQMGTPPVTPGDGGGVGGGGGGGGPADVAPDVQGAEAEGPAEAGVPAEAGDGGEGEVAEDTAEGGGDVAGVTGRGGAGDVAGADELPFTGLDAAATAAVGAATTAAGVALRKAVADER